MIELLKLMQVPVGFSVRPDSLDTWIVECYNIVESDALIGVIFSLLLNFYAHS